MRNWHVCQAKGGFLEVALFLVRSLQFVDTFSPVVNNLDGKRRTLFGTYFFVEFDVEDDPWEKIEYTRGVLGLLPHWRDRPSPLPKSFVGELMHKEERGELDERSAETLVTQYNLGEMLEVRAGNWVGHQLPYLRRQKGLVVMKGGLLGKEVEIKVPEHYIVRPQNNNNKRRVNAPQLGARRR